MFTRIKHRIPVRVRHHWKLLAVCLVFGVVLVTAMGNVQIRPIVTSSAASQDEQIVENIAGTVDLFDSGIAHSVSITFSDADYQRMLDNYIATGEKDWVRAVVTVDGATIRDVGIRLKGNSTLAGLSHKGQTRSLFGDRAGMPGGFPGGAPGGAPAAPPGGAPAAPPGGTQGGTPSGAPGGTQGRAQGGVPGGGMFGGGGGGMGRITLDSGKPEELPWLISFDEFAKGRRYQGRSEIAVRISGMGGGSTVLNEALSLELLDRAGETTQEYSYAGLRVNDRPVKTRLLVEHPDSDFAASLGNGVLYKALSTSTFAYQGEDPTAYDDDFKQVNNKGSSDLKPVIDLLKWVNEVSDADFAAHLADHVDVESFARYVAVENLLLNFDDMAGPGRNYYLWFDLDRKRFRVLSWDHNLTFTGNAGQGPNDSISMGAPGGGFQLPGGFQPPAGFSPPQGGQQAGGTAPGGMRMMMGNKLKERFLAADAFHSVYEDAYRELYRRFYGSNAAVDALNSISATLATVDGYDAAAVKTDRDRLASLIQQRTEALSKNDIVAG